MSSDEPLPPPRSASVPGLAPGRIIGGKYELVRKLGAGAMGEVWAARHETLGEEVAIKLVVRDVDNGDGTSAESRFLLEARVAATLSRKTRHIVAVTDHGKDGSLGYLVMELLAGEPLDARIARTGPQPLAKVVPIVSQIARGLSIAHAEGVIHRDLKPSNVFVTVDEEGRALAKVLDFGIAKLREQLRSGRRGAAKPALDASAAHATQRGFLLGTPAYMSPEQARGKAIDHRADVWALAVIAYHMLTGEFPFDGESGAELFARICRVEPIPLHERRPDLPPIASDFFARAFAPRLEARFQSAIALAGAFEQLEPLAESAKLTPPPPALAILDADFAVAGLGIDDERALRERTGSTLVAAGIPRGRLWPALVAGSLAGAVLVATGALLAIYFEREPPRPATVEVAARDGAREEARDVPPPEPAVSAIAAPIAPPESLPAPPSRPARAAMPSLPVMPPIAPASVAAETAPPPASPPAKRSYDRSEVF
ncbi:MAG: protein kinase [Labilithrix sp.]|nr:protein kinase [Labilithrix sp.]